MRTRAIQMEFKMNPRKGVMSSKSKNRASPMGNHLRPKIRPPKGKAIAKKTLIENRCLVARGLALVFPDHE